MRTSTGSSFVLRSIVRLSRHQIEGFKISLLHASCRFSWLWWLIQSKKVTKSPLVAFSRVFWNDICLISVAFREGANRLSNFLLRSSILLTSKGTSLSGGCRGGKSSGGCGSTFSKFSFWRTDWNAFSSSLGGSSSSIDDSLESRYVGCQNLYSFIHNTCYIIVVASLGVLQRKWTHFT